MKKLMLLAAVIATAMFAANSAQAQVSLNKNNLAAGNQNPNSKLTFTIDPNSDPSQGAAVCVLPSGQTNVSQMALSCIPAGSNINSQTTLAFPSLVTTSGVVSDPPYMFPKGQSSTGCVPSGYMGSYFKTNPIAATPYFQQSGNYCYLKAGSYTAVLMSVVNGKVVSKTGAYSVDWNATTGNNSGAGSHPNGTGTGTGGGSIPGGGGDSTITDNNGGGSGGGTGGGTGGNNILPGGGDGGGGGNTGGGDNSGITAPGNNNGVNTATMSNPAVVSLIPSGSGYVNQNTTNVTAKVNQYSTAARVYLIPANGSIDNACAIVMDAPAGSTNLTNLKSNNGTSLAVPYVFSQANACAPTKAADGKYYLANGDYKIVVASLVNGWLQQQSATFSVTGNNSGGGTGGSDTLPGTGGGTGGNTGGGDTLPGTDGSGNPSGLNNIVTLLGNNVVNLVPSGNGFINSNNSNYQLQVPQNASDSAVYVVPHGQSLSNACLWYYNGNNPYINGQSVNLNALKTGVTVNAPYSYTTADVFPGKSATACGTKAADGKYYLNPVDPNDPGSLTGVYDLVVASLVPVNGTNKLVLNKATFKVVNGSLTGIQNISASGPSVYYDQSKQPHLKNCPDGSSYCLLNTAGKAYKNGKIDSVVNQLNAMPGISVVVVRDANGQMVLKEKVVGK